MRTATRMAAACAAAALTVLTATSAYADTVYNTLDATVDTAFEVMNLTYDGGTGTGSSSTTTLTIQIDGKDAGDHPGCNIQGGPHYVSILASSSDAGVATVQLPSDHRFDACNDTIVATVEAKAIGTSTITFSIDESSTSNDPGLVFNLDQAAFVVNVSAPTSGGNTVCDVDPAAPAWAAAILQASGYKPNSGGFKNYVSRVAGAMTSNAQFGGFVKNSHTQYEAAVLTFLRAETGDPGLVMGRRPGWTCTSS